MAVTWLLLKHWVDITALKMLYYISCKEIAFHSISFRKWFRKLMEGKCVSSVRVIKCLFILPPWENALEQLLQGINFLPVWVLKCFFKLLSCENTLGHWLQGNGVFPIMSS